MAATELDARTAPVLVDLRKGIVGMPTVHAMDDVVKNDRALAAAFRRRGLPVVPVNVAGGAPGRAEQTRGLGALPEGWTDLDEHLKGRGVAQIALAGVSTSAGVESTARHAVELGFNVTLASDAMTDMNLDAHTNGLMRIFPRLGDTGTTREIIDLLEHTRA